MRTRMLGYSFLATVLMVGCGLYDIKSPGQVAGEYVFCFKTGEVEVAVMREDMTYRQEFYRSVLAYQQRGQPLHVNSGTWSYKGCEITWDGWLEFTEFCDPGRLKTVPERFSVSRAAWLGPCSGSDARIVRNDDIYYDLRRVKSRDEVK